MHVGLAKRIPLQRYLHATCVPCMAANPPAHVIIVQVGYGELDYDDAAGEAHDRLKGHALSRRY